jgi:hypothetical protein
MNMSDTPQEPKIKKEAQVPKVRISGSPDNPESREKLRRFIQFWLHLARTKGKNDEHSN